LLQTLLDFTCSVGLSLTIEDHACVGWYFLKQAMTVLDAVHVEFRKATQALLERHDNSDEVLPVVDLFW